MGKRNGFKKMSWKYRYPREEDYDTEEAYEEACAAYESAEDDYVDEYIERRSMRECGID